MIIYIYIFIYIQAGVLVRPMTSGGSRNADTTADAEQIVKRWAAAASSIALIDDDDLASAAIANIILNQGSWVSEGMKCWLAHCIARRGARRSAAGAHEETLWSRSASASGNVDTKLLMQRAMGQLLPFIDEDMRGRRCKTTHTTNGWSHLTSSRCDEALELEAATSISVRQRVCSLLHVGYLCARMGDYGKALKLCTAARKALAPVAAFLQECRQEGASNGEEHLPPWPSLLSCVWHSDAQETGAIEERSSQRLSDSDSENDADEGAALGGYVDCCPTLVLAVAHINCAACLLRMGAPDQALHMAQTAQATFGKAGPLLGRGQSSGVAWQAHSHVHKGIQLVIRAAQLANGIEVAAAEQDERSDVLQLTHDSDDEMPVSCATSMGTALFAKQRPNHLALATEVSDDASRAGRRFGGMSAQHRQIGSFSTQPLGRLGSFGAETNGAGLLMGSARLSSCEVAQQVASLLEDAADLGAAPPSAHSSAHCSSQSSAARHGAVPGVRAPSAASAGAGAVATAASAAAAHVIAGAAASSSSSSSSSSPLPSSPLSDINGAAARGRFGQHGARWRLTHGTRPISASRHKAMGFTPDIGRHAPLLSPSHLLARPGAAAETADDTY